MRDALHEADPTLDDDVAAWFADDCPLPRLTLLGPVRARTRGTPLAVRKAYMTGVLTYLSTRPYGATPDELADALGLTTSKARGYAKTVRDWLGTNPRTGQPHLPDARRTPEAISRGVAIYQVQDLLVDADLFRRLRARGQARGQDGLADLTRALDLVQGPPFSQLSGDAWAWLYEGDRLDHHLTCAIVDVAHTVTTHALRAGDTRTARTATETALLAAPAEEIPHLDLAAVTRAEGHPDQANRILRDQVANRTDDEGPPLDLSQRSHTILANPRMDRTRQDRRPTGHPRTIRSGHPRASGPSHRHHVEPSPANRVSTTSPGAESGTNGRARDDNRGRRRSVRRAARASSPVDSRRYDASRGSFLRMGGNLDSALRTGCSRMRSLPTVSTDEAIDPVDPHAYRSGTRSALFELAKGTCYFLSVRPRAPSS